MFTIREMETRTLLEHVRRHRNVLVLGRGGIGKSALLEHCAGVLEHETLVVKLKRIAPFASFLRELFNQLWSARALDACTFASARGDLDADVLSGMQVGVFLIVGLVFGRALKPRSR